ncbi:MAG: pyruvate, phosphate dikinase [Acidobacteria bacterium]|nr:pyruvate, phosphate dikinase [Acidobacteriota bacterium]MDW7984393.1 pyruvate, phosphate dikinase [Acidobacteriota bacterium]
MDRKAKYVYFFGDGQAEGSGQMKDLLGGKGAGLAEMTNLGLPVPPGFTITTEACRVFYENGEQVPEFIWQEVEAHLRRLEEVSGKRLGEPSNPLLVSVRSGSKFSMPGMMDTILNLGMNDAVAEGLARITGDRRFAMDTYRRFLQMFGSIALGIPKEKFHEALEDLKCRRGVRQDVELTADDLVELVETFKAIIQQGTGAPFPQDPQAQLRAAVTAVFRSWNNPRAQYYRKIHGIPDDLGTACNVVMMVYGNIGEDSGTGVGFTRNPATGEKVLYGEFLPNAQGEDVVAGIRTPLPLQELERRLPDVYAQLRDIAEKLERHYRDVQDFEFTVERGRLYMLQTRVGKRTAQAAVRIAVDMVREGLIRPEEAVLRVDPAQVEQLLHPVIDPAVRARHRPIAQGLPASPGAASGRVVFTADEAVARAENGEVVLLVRDETTPDDIHGMHRAVGILTSRGGMTSHAAVVARGMGKPCVVGCEALQIDPRRRELRVGGTVLREGDWLTIDGSTGEVFIGPLPTVEPQIRDEFATLLEWADQFRKLGVRANADTPRDAEIAHRFGAQGIGLCRTEHMFFGEDRLPHMVRMIMAATAEERQAALDELLRFQIEDFVGIFRAMQGYPVTIRLLDPPLHEFLPKREELIQEIAELKFRLTRTDDLKAMDAILKALHEKERLLVRVHQLHEFNPMLGHRGVRLVITYPEIVEMQTRAIIEAAIRVKRQGIRVAPEIMVPLVSTDTELEQVRRIIEATAERVMEKQGVRVLYQIGTMIEVPRACLVADRIAAYAEFFSFGTNDLTQMTFGFSRDDINKFLPDYLEKKLLSADPFQTLDTEGVGELIRFAIRKGRSARGNLKIGICGEHGGDPASIAFCHAVGMNYVSCSPYRVPVARLAAAQAALRAQAVAAEYAASV